MSSLEHRIKQLEKARKPRKISVLLPKYLQDFYPQEPAPADVVIKPKYYQALQPDGSLVVFQSREGSHYEIFTMNAEGSNIQSLTHPATTLVDEIPSNVSPAWSPDGQSIVFLSNRTEDGSAGDWRIWVMDANGDNQRPLDIDVPIQYSFGAEQMVSWGE